MIPAKLFFRSSGDPAHFPQKLIVTAAAAAAATAVIVVVTAPSRSLAKMGHVDISTARRKFSHRASTCIFTRAHSHSHSYSCIRIHCRAGARDDSTFRSQRGHRAQMPKFVIQIQRGNAQSRRWSLRGLHSGEIPYETAIVQRSEQRLVFPLMANNGGVHHPTVIRVSFCASPARAAVRTREKHAEKNSTLRRDTVARVPLFGQNVISVQFSRIISSANQTYLADDARARVGAQIEFNFGAKALRR